MSSSETTTKEPSVTSNDSSDQDICKYLINNQCAVTGTVTTPTQEICRACTKVGRGINQVTVLYAIQTLQEYNDPVPKYLTEYIQKVSLDEQKTQGNPSTQDSILSSGPGTVLTNLLSWFITKPPNCSCSDRAELMNLWGPEGCKENFRTILGWLRESALDNNYPYNEIAVTALVKLCISISARKVIL
jgi:hypothetical protein